MKLRAALTAVALATSMVASAAVVDPAEPPQTPAGGAPEAGLTAGTVVGAGIVIGLAVAIGASDDDDTVTPAAGTGGTGTF